MKKTGYWFVLVAMCAFVCIGCENSGGKASKNSVLKSLPGTWKITQVVDKNGAKTDYQGETSFEFGKQGSTSDYGSNHNSSLWGYCTVKVNGNTVVNNGTLNIEPAAEDKGVFFYIQNGDSYYSISGVKYFMITSISGSSMRWETTSDQSGYILSRVK